MRRLLALPLLTFATSFLMAAPARAASALALPDPSAFSLFALGVTGLIVGRRIARKRPRD